MRKDIPEGSLHVVLSLLSKSTQKHYKTSLVKWLSFCNKKQIDPYKPKAQEVIEFLTKRYNEGCAYSTINADEAQLQ